MAIEIDTKRELSRAPAEKYFPTWDGVELFYRTWPSATPCDKAIVLMHRGHEHSARFQELVDTLDLGEFSMFAWDARGHGRSPGERGYAEDFSCLVKDLDAFVRFVSREHGISISNMAIVAHSVGAVIAATWIHDYAPPIRAMVLGSPAFRVKLYIPFALFFLRLQMKFRRKAFVKSYVKAAMLTHDPEERAAYTTDALVTRSIAVNILIGMHDASSRLMEDAGAISVPALLLSSGKDWVVDVEAQRQFFDRLSSTDKEMHVYPDFYHDLFHEKDRPLPIAKTREFILGSFENQRPQPSAITNESNRARYESLTHLPELSLTALNWKTQRVFLKSIGRMSAGIRTGWRCGFDSGESLDYVYRNIPGGFSPLGRLIDRVYLSSPGWRGIRLRKVHLQSLIHSAIERVAATGQRVQLLDIACGVGRYVLEVLQDVPQIKVSAQLRDWDPRNLEAARDLAEQLGVSGAELVQGDAFDHDALTSIRPRPNVAIVSGLYELFPDNRMVFRSLQGIAGALEHEGYLIYTNQPWHPQLEMIARVLDNREGKPWVMRCRPQAEMDDLVRNAGFEKLEMLIDADGIFTVSLARKLA
jgi:alpha-beta hydrolase superfamily lysophospholipase/SAM-dependent methyltransferase